MKATPRIAPGVTISPIDTPKGLTFRLSPRDRGAGTLVPARTLVSLLLMDGRRDLEEIHAEMMDLGFRMPDPGKLLAMVRLFEAAGIVDVEHLFSTPGPLRHECELCGQSCEGHLVGPIDNEEAERLEVMLAKLRAMPRDERDVIPNGPATVEVQYDNDLHRVLSFPDGVCIFLNDERLCRLHGKWGPTSKPLPCRMFPIRMARTETGTRVAISPRCFRAHRTYKDGPELNIANLLEEWGVWRPPALVQGLDSQNAESLLSTDLAQVNRVYETAVLHQLGRDNSSLGSLLLMLANLANDQAAESGQTTSGRTTSGQTPNDGPTPPSPEARAKFAQFALAALRSVLGERFSISTAERTSTYAESLTSLIVGVRELDEQNLPDWDDIPEPALSYVRHGLESLVFVREVMSFGSVRAGVLAYSMGVMAARWLSNRDDLEADRLDSFVRYVTAWVRLAGSAEIQEVLFPRPESVDRMLQLLTEF